MGLSGGRWVSMARLGLSVEGGPALAMGCEDALGFQPCHSPAPGLLLELSFSICMKGA